MLFLVAIAAGLIAGLVRGGKLSNLAHLQFRWPWVILAAAAIRVAVTNPQVSQFEASRFVYALALGAIVAWTVWHVGRLPGVWLVSVGAALNLLVILANGLRMPVAPESAGWLVRYGGQLGPYAVMGSGTKLNALADWIRLLPTPEVYSPGDVILAAGLAIILFMSTATPTRIVS